MLNDKGDSMNANDLLWSISFDLHKYQIFYNTSPSDYTIILNSYAYKMLLSSGTPYLISQTDEGKMKLLLFGYEVALVIASFNSTEENFPRFWIAEEGTVRITSKE